jgi:hypothetical protein
VFLTVGETAERVSRRRLVPLPNVRDCRVEKEVLTERRGREEAIWDCGMERERGWGSAAMGGPSWTGTGWSIEVLDMMASPDRSPESRGGSRQRAATY